MGEKLTKGRQWSHGRLPDGRGVIFDGTPLQRHVFYTSDGGLPKAEEDAALALGAAAPDLFEAAKELLDEIEGLAGVEFSTALPHEEAETTWNAALSRVRAALSKATGK